MQFVLSNVKSISFGLVIFGYGIVAPLVTDESTSRFFTLPYRLIVLFLVLSIIISNSSGVFTVSTKTNKYHRFKLDDFALKISYLFIFLYSLRLLIDTQFSQNLTKSAQESMMTWFGACILPAFSFHFIEWEKVKPYFSIAWILSSIIVIEVFIYSLVGSNVLTQQRLTAAALNPISIGVYSLSSVILNLYIIIGTNKFTDFNQQTKLIPIFILPLSVYTLFMAGSRGPFISTLLCLFLFLIASKVRGIKSFKLVGMGAFIILLIVVISSVSASNGSGYMDRLLETADGAEFDPNSSQVYRPQIMQMTIQLIMNNLVFGAGIEVPGLGYPHNLIVESFLTTGFFGGTLFMLINICAVVKCLKIITSPDNSWDWLAMLFVQELVLSNTSACLYLSSSFWCLLFAVLNCRQDLHQLKD